LIATESSFQLPLDIGQLLLLLFLAVWGLHHIAFKRSLPRIVWTPVYIALFVFLALIGLSVFSAQSLMAWVNEWLKWLQMLAMVVAALTLVKDHEWQWLVFGVTMAGLVNAVIGLYEFLGGSGALHLVVDGRFFRAFGTFGQPNPFGGFMGLLAPITLMMAAGYMMRWWRRRQWQDAGLAGFYALATAGLLVGIAISWSRGAWLAIGVAMAVVFFALPRRIRYGAALAAILIGGFGLLWLSGTLPASVTARISSSTADFFAFEDMRGVDITPANYPVVERLAHWQAALNMAQNRPWLGVGFGNYEVVYEQYRLINWHEPLGHAHNYYLNLLAEGGVIGLTGYISLWLIVLWLNWQLRKHPDILARFVGIGLLGTWTYLAVHSLFDNLYVNNLFLHIGLILGILAVLYNQVNHGHINLRLT
jgi:O-antigen ligase